MNYNEKTGIPYGYISLSALNPEVVHELLYGSHVLNLSELMRKAEILKDIFNKYEVECGEIDSVERIHELEEQLSDPERFPVAMVEYQDACEAAEMCAEEDVLHGTYQGVTYQVSWLGGAQAFWIFESPCITEKAGRASPCVPGVGILDSLTGDVKCYDVPPTWRDED